jgi:hypothetical protein
MCRKKLGLAATASKKEALKLAESLMSRINERNSKPNNRSGEVAKRAVLTFDLFTERCWQPYMRKAEITPTDITAVF